MAPLRYIFCISSWNCGSNIRYVCEKSPLLIRCFVSLGNRILSDLPQDNIINVIRNLFVAGTDTTATTLRWALLYLVMNPDVQRKAQEEIDESLGKQVLPASCFPHQY